MNEPGGDIASALADRLHLLLQLHEKSSDEIEAVLRLLKNRTVDQPAAPEEASSPQTPPPKKRRRTLSDDVSEPKFKQEADSDGKSPSFHSLPPRGRPPSDRVSVHIFCQPYGNILSDRGFSPVWRSYANSATAPLLVSAMAPGQVHEKDRSYSLLLVVAGLPGFLNLVSISTKTMMYFSAAGARTRRCRPGLQAAGSTSCGLMSLGLCRTHWGVDQWVRYH